MDLGLRGKVAIVTGGAGGIGAAIVNGFVKEGASVVIADVNLDTVPKLLENAAREGVRISSVRTDVSRKSDAANLVANTLKKFGKIDILVNAAGIYHVFRFIDIEEEEWDQVIDVNAKGVYLVTRAVVPHMIAARQGKIVNISSISGKEALPEESHYVASKFAINGLTQALAKELAEYNINVNAVCPGIVYTSMWEQALVTISKLEGISKEQASNKWIEQIPQKRPQTVEDIASVVLFLSSEVSRNITGEAVSVNGGLRMD
jgi:NAD(P)-dependent dehydrogenase (short-subunit alcohol dehydrogenase family)